MTSRAEPPSVSGQMPVPWRARISAPVRSGWPGSGAAVSQPSSRSMGTGVPRQSSVRRIWSSGSGCTDNTGACPKARSRASSISSSAFRLAACARNASWGRSTASKPAASSASPATSPGASLAMIWDRLRVAVARPCPSARMACASAGGIGPSSASSIGTRVEAWRRSASSVSRGAGRWIALSRRISSSPSSIARRRPDRRTPPTVRQVRSVAAAPAASRICAARNAPGVRCPSSARSSASPGSSRAALAL